MTLMLTLKLTFTLLGYFGYPSKFAETNTNQNKLKKKLILILFDFIFESYWKLLLKYCLKKKAIKEFR